MKTILSVIAICGLAITVGSEAWAADNEKLAAELQQRYTDEMVDVIIQYRDNDFFGHGTHVSGILAGSGAYSTGINFTYTFQGVAKGVNLIDLKVLNATGQGLESGVIAAI